MTSRARAAADPRPLARTDPDVGLYGPESEAWRLNREAMLLLAAGPRALLLQIAHPLVAEGVDQHSDFRSDPWSRLRATLRSYLAIVYGSAPRARAEIRRLNNLHRGITGPVRDPGVRARYGARYEARDPELSLWVHATLVDSTLVAADAWLEPVSRERRARFYQETRPIAHAFGIPDALLPHDLEAFDAYVASMVGPTGEVVVSPTARNLAPSILRPPIGPVVPVLGWVPAPLYSWTLWPAIGLLPDRIRSGYGLPWGPVERGVSAWLVRGFRAWNPAFPTGLRWMPQARAADRRVAGIPG
jgi:uncharacterized protein (DUF2236 family)